MVSSETEFTYPRLLKDGALESFGSIRWEMFGKRDSAGESLAAISGGFKAEMSCAHCGKPVKLDIEVSRRWLLKANEKLAEAFDTDDLDEDIDVVACEEFVNLESWIEDELLLSLPMFARHVACEEELNEIDQKLPDSVDLTETRKPFAQLGELIAKAKKTH